MEIKDHIIKNIENKNYFNKAHIKLKSYYKLLTSQNRIFTQYIKKFKNPILLSGHRKSGNTWVRFVIYNYFNIILNNAQHTFSFNELNKIQYHSLEACIIGPFYSGFPIFYRTHNYYRRIFKYFKLIYLWRNPLDTLISRYYVVLNRSEDPPKSIDHYILSNLNSWIHDYKHTIDKADLVLNYGELKENPFIHFSRVIRLINNDFNENALRKSIEMASFKNLKKMAVETKQHYGMHNPKKFKGQFLRSGKSRQYLYELKPSTINLSKLILKKNNLDFNI